MGLYFSYTNNMIPQLKKLLSKVSSRVILGFHLVVSCEILKRTIRGYSLNYSLMVVIMKIIRFVN
jgi:hypothetical protein